MQKFPKIIISAFLAIFIAQMFGLIFLLTAPNSTRAAVDSPDIQVPIGNFKFTQVIPDKEGKLSIPWIGEYISAIYKYAIGVVGILAAVVLMVGGIVWITAGGNQARIGEAKAWIGASLTGLIIALSSYTLLWMVNPALVQFRPIKVATITDKSNGCCSKDKINLGLLSKTTCTKDKSGNWGGENSVWDDTKKECVAPQDTCSGKQEGVCIDPQKPYCVLTGRIGYDGTYSCAASQIGSKCYPKIALTCPYPLVCSDNADGICEEKDSNSCVGKSFGTPCGENKACDKNEECVACEPDVGNYCQATPCCINLVCEKRGSDLFDHCYNP